MEGGGRREDRFETRFEARFEANDRPPLGLVLRLVVGTRPLGPGRAPLDREARAAGEELGDLLAVGEEVGREGEPAARPEEAEDEVDRLGVEEAALLVPDLRPR